MTSPKRLLLALAAAFIPACSALYKNGSVVAPCDSPIYCHGDILHQVQLAAPFSDSKTFVDMPALKPLKEIQAAFDKLDKPLKNDSALNRFLTTYFADAGQELKEVPPKQLNTNATFLNHQNDTVIREFVQKVIQIWPDLTRTYQGSAPNCTGCPNSYVPVERPFVVAGGRFREPYYWDTYWILQGLLRTGGSFVGITNGTIHNFLDLVEQYGFVPNGARVYYLNRSQPPLLSQMVKLYLSYTNDTAILDRALPLLVKEHEFWMKNRTANVKVDGRSYTLNRYNVQNNQPRPESYLQDYVTAKNTSYYATSGIIYPQKEALNDTTTGDLYGNLASGAETGWDFSTRWISRPEDSVRDTYFPLRYIRTRSIIPVDLNSILYGNEVAISAFFNQTGNSTAAREWADLAANRSEAMTKVLWNETAFSYFDYNLTSSSHNMYVPADGDASDLDKPDGAPRGQQLFFHAGQFFPFWTGAAPAYLKNNPQAVMQAYQRVEGYLSGSKGGVPATNLATGQQWDQPNVWPPLQHVLMEGLLNTPSTFGKNDPSYKKVEELALKIGQRYLDSAFCTWYATGGSTSETPRLEGVSGGEEGIMFEKYADNATNVAGGGGEYEVVEGFGWSNGVLIWTADTFGNRLRRPDCGEIKAAKPNGKRSAVELHAADGRRVKRTGRRGRGVMGSLDLW